MGSSSSPPSSALPLTPASIREAHALIFPYIHRTPLLTNATLDRLASSPLPLEIATTSPKFNLYFKSENLQKIGAFKARGAHHAVIRLIQRLGIDEVKRRGVVTHSSGNHAQALALAAHTFEIPAYIVMPGISTPSKIAGTKHYAGEENVIFSGSTSVEREKVVEEVIRKTNAILIPPYDHADIILGQGTTGLEMAEQYDAMKQSERTARDKEEERKRVKVKEARSQAEFEQGMDGWFARVKAGMMLDPPAAKGHAAEDAAEATPSKKRAVCSAALPQAVPSSSANTSHALDAIIAPIGGGGLLGGIATYFSRPPFPRHKTLVFGAEPSFEGANDAELGRRSNERVPHVSSLTIADGLRTPVGLLNWSIVSDRSKVESIYSVSEQQIKDAMRLVFERMKVVVEPSGCVGLAVILYNTDFRKMVAARQRDEGTEKEGWDVGVVFSGGNTTMDAIVSLYGEQQEKEREEGKVGVDGGKEVQDVAG